MTIKDLADHLGVSSQSVYKRLRNHGVKLDTLKDKASGEITADGLQVVARVFGVDLITLQPPPDPWEGVDNPVEFGFKRLTTEVEKVDNPDSTLIDKITALESECDGLRQTITEQRQEIVVLQTKVDLLESERDNLRQTLQAQQQLTAMTLQKIPALPAPEQTHRAGGLFGWWQRRKKSKEGAEIDGN